MTKGKDAVQKDKHQILQDLLDKKKDFFDSKPVKRIKKKVQKVSSFGMGTINVKSIDNAIIECKSIDKHDNVDRLSSIEDSDNPKWQVDASELVDNLKSEVKCNCGEYDFLLQCTIALEESAEKSLLKESYSKVVKYLQKIRRKFKEGRK